MTQYVWDKLALRFRNAMTMRFVAEKDVRDAVDTVAARTADELEQLSRRLVDGSIDLGTWEREASRLIKNSHVAAGMVARGGKRQMDQPALGRIGAKVKAQYGYLREFAREIDRGDVDVAEKPAGFLARIRMYGEAITQTFEAIRRRDMIFAGYQEERRYVNSSRPCVSCDSYAGEGWVPAGTLPDTGSDCECKANCKCTFRYRLRSPSQQAA